MGKVEIPKYSAIVIGGSAGSFPVVTKILASLPNDFPLPLIITLHRLKHVRNGFLEALSIKSNIKLVEPFDKESIKKGQAYLAPANYHMCIELGKTFSLSTEPMVNNSRPAIDLTFNTASYVYKQSLIGILLSGANNDGAVGLKKIVDKGGLTIVQKPEECVIDTMPKAALSLTSVDHIFAVDEIVSFLKNISSTN